MMEFTEEELKVIQIALEVDWDKREGMLNDCTKGSAAYAKVLHRVEQIQSLVYKISAERKSLWEHE